MNHKTFIAIMLVFAMLSAGISGCVGGERKDGDTNDGTPDSGGDSGGAGDGTGNESDIDKIEAQRKLEVLLEFYHAWSGYVNYAWGHDILKPVSKEAHDWYDEPLLMTIVDSLDTLYLMGFDSQFFTSIEYVKSNLNFDKDIEVQVFEVTIRLLGGLLSAYQYSGDPALLDLAKDLGDRLMPAFGSIRGIPYPYINLKTGATSGATTNPAEVGTLMLEFGMLSKLTGDNNYYDAAKKAVVALYDLRSPVTNLVGSSLNVETGFWMSPNSHIGGSIDSYYEYLLKASVLFDDSEFKDMYDVCIAGILDNIVVEYEGKTWCRVVNMVTGTEVETSFGSLHMFMPGMLASSGHLEPAKKLMVSGYEMWNKWGIEPELMDYTDMSIVYGNYELRPEIIESAYHLWKITGDETYREMGYKMFLDIVEHCKTEIGYTKLENVETKKQGDYMDSFFLAETLKYCYLLFDDSRLDYDNAVFNTEAHPLYKVSPFSQ